jgi:predicted amidohydrolase YtcJ
LRRHAELRRKTGQRRSQRVSKAPFEVDHLEIVSLDTIRTDQRRSARTEVVIMRFPVASCFFVVAVFACAACREDQPTVEAATLVLRNGTIATVDSAKPQAQAIAFRSDTIAAVGSNDDIEPFIGPNTEVVDLAGQFAIPGFIDGHGHFMNLGQSKMNLDLMDVKNWNEIVTMVGEAARNAKPGEWILGRGWHQEKWDTKPEPSVEGFPLHDTLSKVSPNNPVMLTHASGHAAFVNAKAMEVAGITARTPNPPGGEILKDPSGRPIGMLRETAQNLAGKAHADWRSKKTAEENRADAHRRIQLAVQESLANGITSFQDAGEDFQTIDIIKEALTNGELGIRLWVMVRDTNENLKAKLPTYKAIGLGDKRLSIAAIKQTIDGALGSRGAWLLEPYADLPGHSGLNTLPVENVQGAAQIALDTGVQLNVHAIGDRANRTVLDIYEAAFKSRPDAKDLRWRIEHAQHLNAADIPRFGQLGVIASMQGIHATSDAPFVIARLGAKRAEEGAYVWQKLMKSGAIVSNGTDTPVERINPIANYYATVTRKLKDGTTFYPDQRMTREEALKSYTWNAAYAAKEETIKGSLAAGKLADVTVLSKDLLTVPDEEILSTKVVYTIVGGKIVYRGNARALTN